MRDGNIRGTILDEEGEPLAGANVLCEGPQAPLRLTTSERGIFRFLNLPIGLYRVTVEYPGLATYIQENITVNAGSFYRDD